MEYHVVSYVDDSMDPSLFHHLDTSYGAPWISFRTIGYPKWEISWTCWKSTTNNTILVVIETLHILPHKEEGATLLELREIQGPDIPCVMPLLLTWLTPLWRGCNLSGPTTPARKGPLKISRLPYCDLLQPLNCRKKRTFYTNVTPTSKLHSHTSFRPST